MMKPLSEDLRERIVAAYGGPEGSYPKVAVRFQVSESSVRRFVKQWRERGTLAPRPPANGQPCKLNQEERETLSMLVVTQVDASQDEIRHRLAENTGILVSQPTICRMLQRARITRKKRRNAPKNSTGRR